MNDTGVTREARQSEGGTGADGAPGVSEAVRASASGGKVSVVLPIKNVAGIGGFGQEVAARCQRERRCGQHGAEAP